MDLDLKGDIALVAASSGGLGKAVAASMVAEGANVVINGRSEERLRETATELEGRGDGEVVAQVGDLTDPDAIEQLVRRPIDEFGRLDHLVTSAGGPPRLRFPESTDEDWYDAFDLLVMAPVRLARIASEHLSRDGGGSITAITSRAVKEANPSNVLSSSVRMGVIGLLKTLSKEIAPEVRVNAILPSGIDSPRVWNGLESAVDRGDFDTYEEALESRTGPVPLNRLGNVSEIGDAVVFLCSDRAGYINGTAVPVDGGVTRSNL